MEVLRYMSIELLCKARNKLAKISVENVFECSAVTCTINKEKLVFSIYRPPQGNVGRFLNCTQNVLSQIFNENKKDFIAGDIKIKMLRTNENYTNLMSLLSSFNITPTIFQYTNNCKYI